MSEPEKQLLEVARKFVKDSEIRCAESIWQMDHVIENAYEFIEEICKIVGYYQDSEAGGSHE